MSILTAQDIIRKSLQKIGVLADGESPTASQANDALDALNAMLDSWSGRSLLTTAVTKESFPLIAGQYIYTIGVGGNFNTSKPIGVTGAFLRDSQNLDYDVFVIPLTVYDSYTDKALTSSAARPESLFYDAGAAQQSVQLGTVYLYPIPDAASSYTLYLESEKSFTEFSSLTSAFTFPPAYKNAMIFNLCIDLATDYGRTITKEVEEMSHEYMRIIESVNSRNKGGVMGLDFPGKMGTSGYNIYNDSSAG